MELLQTTLCYLERDGQYLMLHRIKKKKDVNKDKWIGVGGKFEPGEDALACVLREVREETGLTMNQPHYRGIFSARPGRQNGCTCSPAPILRERCALATRGTWNGWTRTGYLSCPSGRGTRSSLTCWPKTSPSSTWPSIMKRIPWCAPV